MREAALRPLSPAFEGLSSALAPATALARVQAVWEHAVGPALAGAAYPSAEREGVLTLSCAAAVWAQELDLMAYELIARLNAALGSETVRELRCRTV